MGERRNVSDVHEPGQSGCSVRNRSADVLGHAAACAQGQGVVTSPLEAIARVGREISQPTALVGVYLLIAEDEIVYIGQSVDVWSRVAAHAKRFSFDRVIMIDLAREDLRAYEAALIRALNPRLTFRCLNDDARDAEILRALGIAADPVARAAFELRRGTCWSPETRQRIADANRYWHRRRKRIQRRRVLATGAWLARQLAGIES